MEKKNSNTPNHEQFSIIRCEISWYFPLPAPNGTVVKRFHGAFAVLTRAIFYGFYTNSTHVFRIESSLSTG